MQQVGTVAAHIAEGFFSLFPKFLKSRFLSKFNEKLTIRRRQRLRFLSVFFTLFVFPCAVVTIGYHYVQGQGGFLKTISEFGHLELQNVNLIVYEGDKVSLDRHVDEKIIQAVLPVTKGMSMFDINLNDIRKTVNDVPWVKSSSVKLVLPSSLNINVYEQHPLALWKRDDEMVYLIDEDGAEITNQNLKDYNYLPKVVGYGANTRIYEYLALFNDYAEIFKHINSGHRISNRRWTLVTHNNINISLSENNPRASLEQLIKLQKSRDIFNDNISEIDLRIAGKTFIRQKGATTLSVYSNINI